MAPNYAEESLKCYKKQQLIKLFLEVQQQSNETVSKLSNEIKLLKENYKKLESDILVSKIVGSLLTDQMPRGSVGRTHNTQGVSVQKLLGYPLHSK